MTLSYWLDRQYTPREPLLDVVTTQYCIVGGGITGVSLAYYLAKLGKHVILLEADEIASKASGRNGGLLVPGLEKRYDLCVQDYGRPVAHKIWQLTSQAIEIMKTLCEEEHIDAQFLQEGVIKYAMNQEELNDLITRHAPYSQLLTKEEAQKKSLRKCVGALEYPKGASYDPATFVRGLARLAEEEGATLYENALVVDWIHQTDHYSIETSGGVVHAQKIILCTNAYTKELIDLPIRPVRNQALATSSFKRTLTGGHYSADGWMYFKQTPSGEVILGGGRDKDKKTEETDVDDLNPTIQGYLTNYLGNLPLSGAFAITHRWAGIMGFTPDKLPIIGEVKKDIHVLAGFSGLGNALGFLCAKEYAQKLINGFCELPLEPFSPKRFS
ncbi:FAD-binding oxidoreductase [Candidatus Woesearchaeota archaeon]|nr:MAG: FAD-binding oxidoreductase [Candidatus Woesearchaeota archaeon]